MEANVIVSLIFIILSTAAAFNHLISSNPTIFYYVIEYKEPAHSCVRSWFCNIYLSCDFFLFCLLFIFSMAKAEIVAVSRQISSNNTWNKSIYVHFNFFFAFIEMEMVSQHIVYIYDVKYLPLTKLNWTKIKKLQLCKSIKSFN